MMRTITLERRMPQRPRIQINDQIDFILGEAIRGTRAGWECKGRVKEETQDDEGWIFTVKLSLEKTKEDKPEIEERQWHGIVKDIIKAGKVHLKFNKYPWIILEKDLLKNLEDDNNSKLFITDSTKNGIISDVVVTIEDLKEKFPHDLLNDETGTLIENHPAFKGIYGRSAHIRMTLSAIWSFIVSNGEKTTHTLLYGLPACAKTRILFGLEELFGPGSVLKLDATNTTRPGLEKLIFEDLEDFVPPFIFMEEIEKANEETLRMWLGAMDERHEFRKINYRKCEAKRVKFLGMATANDKKAFDLMMGGRVDYPGALSSRFQQQLECPRPSWEEMEMILERELPKIDGKPEWIEPCIELGKLLDDNDPRKIISFLDGRERLLSGDYQRDCLSSTGHKEKISQIKRLNKTAA